jgi:glycosyltransferase involved in cell wall biosynthesis
VWYAHAAARRLGADLIYTWLPQTAALESHLKRPTVLEMHADVAGAFGAWWLRRFWSGSGRRLLVTTTHALRGALERSTGMVFPKASVVVAPNGVDLERYANVPDAAEARARLHLAEAFTAGFTGHFYPGRGTDLLFELARRMPDVKFLWVGGTPQTVAEWRSRLSAAGQSNVTLTGFVDNSLLPLYQAAADVLLMPYGRAVAASSGQDIAEVINPMKMFEYMAAGRAIITADLPVIREVLDETRAVFCAPGNVEDWMSAILGLKAAADRRLRLAQNGRREVETCTWRAREERILQALELG